MNKKQQEACSILDGPLIILAGAWTGKTATMVARVWALLQKWIEATSILALTFTNKAANEMRERIEKMYCNGTSFSWFIGTFHSFWYMLLRKHIEYLHLGITSRFVVYDREDTKDAIQGILKKYEYKEYVSDVLEYIFFLKRNPWMLENQNGKNIREYEKTKFFLYEEYQSILQKNNACDFDDLLVYTRRLLKQYPFVLEEYQNTYRYVVVDEFQDVNLLQYEIVSLISQKHRNIGVVWDDRQMIYGWRGSDTKIFFKFFKDFPESKVILLEQNYRSTKNIVCASNALIEKNDSIFKKTLYTENEEWEKISILSSDTREEEAEKVARMIIQAGIPYEKIAVLYRIHGRSRVVEQVFVYYNIPYIVVWWKGFYERKEVKDIIAWISLLYNPYDIRSFLRIIDIIPCWVGKSSVVAFFEEKKEKVSFLDILENIWKKTKKRREKSNKFWNLFAMSKDLLESWESLKTLMSFFIEKGEYDSYLKNISQWEYDYEGRKQNIYELMKLAEHYHALRWIAMLERFLGDIAVYFEKKNQWNKKDSVNLMTLHCAKWLEFDMVFILWLEEGIFPLRGDKADLEEERRLMYVGMTRAHKKLVLSYVEGYSWQRKKSRFLEEIPASFVHYE